MRLFAYEFITGGGTLAKPSWGEPHGSLLSEGAAMIRALLEDLTRVPGLSVTAMWDVRLPMFMQDRVEWVPVHDRLSEANEFDRLAKAADATLVIAPEIEDELYQRCKRVVHVGGKLIGSSLDFIELTSDKQRTIDTLQAADIPVPQSRVIEVLTTRQRRAEPMIVKPRWGAGSCDLHLVSPDESIARFATDGSFLLQSFCTGQPASMCFLCGKQQTRPLVPFFQNLGPDLSYDGGTRITDSAMQRRVRKLGTRALEAFEDVRGYVGVDMVLGEKTDGSEDVVMEINPRLTTSYIGHRVVVHQNLADSMLRCHRGEPVQLTMDPRETSFSSDGKVF